MPCCRTARRRPTIGAWPRSACSCAAFRQPASAARRPTPGKRRSLAGRRQREARTGRRIDAVGPGRGRRGTARTVLAGQGSRSGEGRSVDRREDLHARTSAAMRRPCNCCTNKSCGPRAELKQILADQRRSPDSDRRLAPQARRRRGPQVGRPQERRRAARRRRRTDEAANRAARASRQHGPRDGRRGRQPADVGRPCWPTPKWSAPSGFSKACRPATQTQAKRSALADAQLDRAADDREPAADDRCSTSRSARIGNSTI